MHLWLLSCTMPARDDENKCNSLDKNNKNALCPSAFIVLDSKNKETDISNNVVVFLSQPIIPAAVIYKQKGLELLRWVICIMPSSAVISIAYVRDCYNTYE